MFAFVGYIVQSNFVFPVSVLQDLKMYIFIFMLHALLLYRLWNAL